MSPKHLAPVALFVALVATACNPQEPPVDPAGGINDPMAEEEVLAEETEQALTADLGESVDLGDGLTLAMVDLRREIAEDGFNAVTGEEGALPYVAWRWELTNDSDTDLQLGGETSSCFVGDPLAEAEQPVLGESVNGPDLLAAGQTATWDVDCWMAEEETALQYTLELYDTNMTPIYTVTFTGDVP